MRFLIRKYIAVFIGEVFVLRIRRVEFSAVIFYLMKFFTKYMELEILPFMRRTHYSSTSECHGY